MCGEEVLGVEGASQTAQLALLGEQTFGVDGRFSAVHLGARRGRSPGRRGAQGGEGEPLAEGLGAAADLTGDRRPVPPVLAHRGAAGCLVGEALVGRPSSSRAEATRLGVPSRPATSAAANAP